MADYRLSEHGVVRTADSLFIPSDPLNSHWQEYQAWLALGNEPDPAVAQGQDDQIRGQRNALLAGSDWTQLADSPLSDDAKKAWAKYRQALRDFPTKKVGAAWPEAPK